MRITLLEDNTITADYDDGQHENINSGHAGKALGPVTRALAEAFTYGDVVARAEGVVVFDTLAFDGGEISAKTTEYDNDLKKVNDQRTKYDPLEDITGAPQRVQDFAAIVFTDEVRAAYIEALPLAPVMVQIQRVVRVQPGTEGALEKILPIPDGEEVIDIANGRATSRQIHERKVWLMPLQDENGDPVMVAAKSQDENGEPIMQRYHKKTGGAY